MVVLPALVKSAAERLGENEVKRKEMQRDMQLKFLYSCYLGNFPQFLLPKLRVTAFQKYMRMYSETLCFSPKRNIFYQVIYYQQVYEFAQKCFYF